MCLIGCLSLLPAFSAGAEQARICGLARVEKVPFGVKAYFDKRTILDVWRDGKGWKVIIDPDAPEATMPFKGGGPFRALAALPGDRFWWTVGMHAGCNLTVILVNDSIGIQAIQGVSAPGLPAWKDEKFVPAE